MKKYPCMRLYTVRCNNDSNKPDCLRGMNGINPIVYGDRTGGTCDFYRMSRDWSFGGTRME